LPENKASSPIRSQSSQIFQEYIITTIQKATSPRGGLSSSVALSYRVTGLYFHVGLHRPVACPGILFGRGVQQIQLRTEDRENGNLGAVAPYSGLLEAAVIWYKKFYIVKFS